MRFSGRTRAWTQGFVHCWLSLRLRYIQNNNTEDSMQTARQTRRPSESKDRPHTQSRDLQFTCSCCWLASFTGLHNHPQIYFAGWFWWWALGWLVGFLKSFSTSAPTWGSHKQIQTVHHTIYAIRPTHRAVKLGFMFLPGHVMRSANAIKSKNLNGQHLRLSRILFLLKVSATGLVNFSLWNTSSMVMIMQQSVFNKSKSIRCIIFLLNNVPLRQTGVYFLNKMTELVDADMRWGGGCFQEDFVSKGQLL